MGNQLLVRAYKVGCGDCIYVRIPDGKDGFHILIDYGTKSKEDVLRNAILHLESELPEGSKPKKKRLDLIVATHRHEDHIKGFKPEWFANIEVKNIWLSVAMDPDHPQAKGVNNLRAFAKQKMTALTNSGKALSPEAEALTALYGVSNDVADALLMEQLPKDNGIEAKFVHSGMKHDLKLPAGTKIHILAPEKDVDHFYLGEEVDATLKGLQSFTTGSMGTATGASAMPANISSTDFKTLQSRMLSNGLAFAAKESSIQNNLSVVLLIEWKKRRLLFVGDAEWAGEFKAGKDNGSWNVMWEMHRDTHLAQPLDFLKVGHHGSTNATPHPPELLPPNKKAAKDGVYSILDTILPVPKSGSKPTAQAIVSTAREEYAPIPEGKLLVELARRVSNTRNYGKALKDASKDPQLIWTSNRAKKGKYFEDYEKAFLDLPQPLRTDLEFELSNQDFVEVELKPGR